MSNLRSNKVRFFENSLNKHNKGKDSENSGIKDATPFGLGLKEKMSNLDNTACCSGPFFSPTQTPSGGDAGADFDT